MIQFGDTERVSKFKFVLIPLLACLTACNVGRDIVWSEPNYHAQLSLAKEHGRVVFAYYSTQDCVPCLNLEQTLFKDPAIVSLINQNSIPVKLMLEDSDDQGYYQYKPWGLALAPTLLLVNADGSLRPSPGFLSSPDETARWLIQNLSAG